MFKLLFRKDERGFTLVEVIMASVLLLTVLTVSYAAVNYKSVTNIGGSTDYATALNEARAVITDAANVLAGANAIEISNPNQNEIILSSIVTNLNNPNPVSTPVVDWNPPTLTINGQTVKGDSVTKFNASLLPAGSNPANVVELSVTVTVNGQPAQLSRVVHTLTVGTSPQLGPSGQPQTITQPWIQVATVSLVQGSAQGSGNGQDSGQGSGGGRHWGWFWRWGWVNGGWGWKQFWGWDNDGGSGQGNGYELTVAGDGTYIVFNPNTLPTNITASIYTDSSLKNSSGISVMSMYISESDLLVNVSGLSSGSTYYLMVAEPNPHNSSAPYEAVTQFSVPTSS